MGTHRRAAIAFVAIGLVFGSGAAAGVTPAGAAANTPKVTVTPSSALKPGQTVKVAGTGFPAKTPLIGLECPRGTLDPTACDLGNLAQTKTDAQGKFTTSFVVHRTLLGQHGFVDCAPSDCELLVSNADGGFQTGYSANLGFDPNAKLPKTTVTVTPSMELKNNQSLALKAKGFDSGGGSGDVVEVLECLVSGFQCSLLTIEQEPAGGSFSARVPARREMVNQRGRRVDCADSTKTCEIVVIDALDVDYHAVKGIAFDPTLPPPPPASLTVKPNTKLPYYARVAISGKNWAANDVLLLLECAQSSAAGCVPLAALPTDSHGRVDASPMLVRDLPNPFDPTSAPTDCAAVKGGCELQVLGFDGSQVTVPVKFDPKAPIPPAPTATASPAPPYHDGQTVHVKGKHFAPKAAFAVEECVTVTHPNEIEFGCVEPAGVPHTTSATGALAGSAQVVQKLDTPDGTIDCTKKNTQCTLAVVSEGGAEVDLPLSFTTAAAGGAHANIAHLSHRARSRWLSAATTRAVVARAALPRPLLTALAR